MSTTSDPKIRARHVYSKTAEGHEPKTRQAPYTDTKFERAWHVLRQGLSNLDRSKPFLPWGGDLWRALSSIHWLDPDAASDAVDASVAAARLAQNPLDAALIVLVSVAEELVCLKAERRLR